MSLDRHFSTAFSVDGLFMTRAKDLLIEIGTEELPPKALKRLAEAFADGIHTGLESHAIGHKSYQWYATPRRLAVIVNRLVPGQKDHQIVKRGPALASAFDASGNPTRAAEGFARSCGVEVAALEQQETDKGTFLIYQTLETGKLTAELLPDIINNALARLPIPKRMRWADRDAEFVRPVHWSVVLFGNETIVCDILGTRSGNITYGHRFHHPKPIRLASATTWLKKATGRANVSGPHCTPSACPSSRAPSRPFSASSGWPSRRATSSSPSSR